MTSDGTGSFAAGPAAAVVGAVAAARGGDGRDVTDAETAVTELYRLHALGLTRLAHVMLGDRTAAEDVMHDAFYGLYQHWDKLADPRKAAGYLRTSVLNGCRSELRRSRRRKDRAADRALADLAAQLDTSAEAAAVTAENRTEVMAAIRRLSHRQREVLILRYYLDEPEAVIAELLGIGGSTVRSTLHRALAALSADLREKA
jgi:RNA polymerase sigma factor (sigma-70 family)